MITTEIKVGEAPQKIYLGRRGEHLARQIRFDCSYFAEVYGAGEAVLLNKRSQDTEPYEAGDAQEGNVLPLTVSELETYYVGYGECELIWYVNNTIAKSVIYPTWVDPDIGEQGEEPPLPPSYQPSFYCGELGQLPLDADVITEAYEAHKLIYGIVGGTLMGDYIFHLNRYQKSQQTDAVYVEFVHLAFEGNIRADIFYWVSDQRQWGQHGYDENGWNYVTRDIAEDL